MMFVAPPPRISEYFKRLHTLKRQMISIDTSGLLLFGRLTILPLKWTKASLKMLEEREMRVMSMIYSEGDKMLSILY